MQKEEFPTFLNEQPTIIFGRTGRELLIIAIGGILAWSMWGRLGMLRATVGGLVLLVALMTIPVILSLVVALISVAGRSIEEWCFILAFYAIMPKLYLYMPHEEEATPDPEDLTPTGSQYQLLLPAGQLEDIDDES